MKESDLKVTQKRVEELESQLAAALDKNVQLEKMKRFTDRMLRHDLKSPLSSISSGLYFLEQKKDLPLDVQRVIRIMKTSSMHMNDMIEHSLDIYRMEEGTYDLPQVHLSIDEVIEASVSQLIGLANVMGVSIVVDPINGVEKAYFKKRIKGDFAKLLCLFSNLLKNALEASDAKDEVRISIELKKDSYEVSLHNTGVIPQDVRADFFESHTTSGKKKGTGLGTYSARLITQFHGGDIRFVTCEEKGTDLIVELPFVSLS